MLNMRNNTLAAILGTLIVIMPTTWCAGGLEDLMDNDGKIWSLTPDEFMSAQGGNGFRWLSASNKNNARSVNDQLTFAGAKSIETIARFLDGKLHQIVVYVYTRGDAGEIGESEFEELVADTEKQITAWAGIEPLPVVEEARPTGVRLAGKSWNKKPHRVDMEWSYAKRRSVRGTQFPYRAEYIRLQLGALVAAKNTAPQIHDNSMKNKLARSNLKDLPKRVLKSGTGDVKIEGVPMVDQGMKGYCVAATVERVLRYYGNDVDQHEIAQLARSSADEGTSPTMMAEGLKRAGTKLGIKLTIYHQFKANDFLRMIDKYNRNARRKKLPQIETGQMIMVSEVYQQMDTETLKETQAKPEGYLRGFMNDIIKDIDLGMPLAWSVVLGKIEEDPPLPQAAGGHMRLIIGYNTKTAEIFYTDSWGRGHECKRMNALDAWAITTALYSLRPRP